MTELPRVRWYRGISVRLALIVAVTMLGSMVIAYKVEGWASRRSAEYLKEVPEGTDFDAYRDADGVPRDDYGRRMVTRQEWEVISARINRYIGIGLALSGILTSLAVGWAVSLRVTKRLRELALGAREPVGEGRALPAPLRVGGADEIGVLAASMNDMRERVHTLVEQLAERDRERRNWIALVSHDLRNPLQALTACIDRAAFEARRLDDGPARGGMLRLLGTARLDVDRFQVLTQDLLDIARLDADNSLILEPVPPGELARRAAEGMRVLAEVNGCHLEVEVARGCQELQADGRRMLRALENLLRNAIQHAQARVTLRVEPRTWHAEGSPGPARRAVRFSVDDDGPGLPTLEDGTVDVPRLGAYKSRDDSAGLGLVVVRRVAESHCGTLGAYNRVAGAAASNPAGAEGAEGAEGHAASSGHGGSGGTVWIEIPGDLGGATSSSRGPDLDVEDPFDDDLDDDLDDQS
ncbi:MAG: HAMP domain-containing sensor histidine kinase [Planctomycetota bacterium]